MDIPPNSSGMSAEGLRVALREADRGPILGTTHLAAGHEDAKMDAEDKDDHIVDRLHALLSNTRAQLARAVEEANQLQAWSSDEEGADNHPSGTARVEEPDAEALAKMSTKEREAVIKRARNREAARRSRQRKNERINQLCKDIKTLQQENVVLLKCIEDFTKKAIDSKEHQLRMKEQLAALATTSTGIDTASLLAQYQDDSMLLPMEVEDASETQRQQPQMGTTGAAGPSSSSLPAAFPNRASLVAGLSLPSLAELQNLQSTEAAGGGQLTARGGGTLSARGAAVAEHIAMLSKENSPRDDEIDLAVGTGGTTAGAAAVLLPTATPTTVVEAMPDGSSVDFNMLFGAWDGSDKK
ncbi:hypothetical protein Ndes2526B_g09592 [Nannochloris sp. 'desiccata']|nr:hypothetical protein NADE_007461 [Chlorella desiccata (nom. nud.)]KAH7615746.1 hypothetical protein NADE_007536 [Chlorella desiccata (nom. nud.)]